MGNNVIPIRKKPLANFSIFYFLAFAILVIFGCAFAVHKEKFISNEWYLFAKKGSGVDELTFTIPFLKDRKKCDDFILNFIRDKNDLTARCLIGSDINKISLNTLNK